MRRGRLVFLLGVLLFLAVWCLVMMVVSVYHLPSTKKPTPWLTREEFYQYMAQTQHSCHQGQSRRLCCHRLGRVDRQTGVHIEVEDAVGIDVAVDQWCESPEILRRQAP